MAYAHYAPHASLADRIAYQTRVIRVMSRTEFKLKYADSVLGYLWSLGKPLLYFGVLYVVFDRLFRQTIHEFPVYLLLGIVLFTYLSDAVTASLPSIVARGPLLRRVSFSPIVIPIAAMITAMITLAVNFIALAVFIAAGRLVPRITWLALLPLLVELSVFVAGLALIMSVLYVRFRDIGHIWEVGSSVLFFSTPVMYPITIIPTWARPIIGVNPLVQVLQDSRRLILGPNAHAVHLIGGHGNHLVPVGTAVAVFILGVLVQRQQAGQVAELA